MLVQQVIQHLWGGTKKQHEHYISAKWKKTPLEPPSNSTSQTLVGSQSTLRLHCLHHPSISEPDSETLIVQLLHQHCSVAAQLT